MQEWRGRAEKAEAERDELKAQLAAARESIVRLQGEVDRYREGGVEVWVARDLGRFSAPFCYGEKPELNVEGDYDSYNIDGSPIDWIRLPFEAFPDIKPGECIKARIVRGE